MSEIGTLALFLRSASRNPTEQSNIVSVPTNFNLIPLKSKKSEQSPCCRTTGIKVVTNG